MSKYKTSEGFNPEAKGKKVLEPGIYEGTIVNVSIGEKPKFGAKEDDEADLSIDIEFKDNKSGRFHLDQTTEPKPTDKSTQEQVDTRMFERMMHIASPFLTSEELTALKTELEATDSFSGFAKAYTKGLQSKVGKTEIVFKVVGSTFDSTNGKQSSSKIPNFSAASSMYPVVIRKDKGMLKFSKSDNESNAKYWALTNSSSNGGSNTPPPAKDDSDELFKD